VILYTNTAEQIGDELWRKRKKPQAVFFCPSSDPFQPVPEVLEQTYKSMELLLSAGVGVQFTTKAAVPEEFLKLFAKRSDLVCAQIAVTFADEKMREIFEPFAASIANRLDTLKKLMQIGAKTSARADPLIYGITDSDEQLRSLFSAVIATGCKEIAVSYLFLRAAIARSMKADLKDRDFLRKITGPYLRGPRLKLGEKDSYVVALPKEIREKAFERIKKLSMASGLALHICGCMNPDITGEICNITRLSDIQQAQLFA
jgi:DNA repair photolyase